MQILYFKVLFIFFRIRKIPLQCAKKESYNNYGEISETVLPNLTQISDCLEQERFNDMQTFWQTDKLTQTFALAELTRIHHKNNSSLLVSYVRVIQAWKLTYPNFGAGTGVQEAGEVQGQVCDVGRMLFRLLRRTTHRHVHVSHCLHLQNTASKHPNNIL